MKTSNKYLINIAAKGVFVLFILSLAIFWGRKICELTLFEITVENDQYYYRPDRDDIEHRTNLDIIPSGLMWDIDRDPNTKSWSRIHVSLSKSLEEAVLNNDYLWGLYCSGPDFIVFTKQGNRPVYFDDEKGLYVRCDLKHERMANGKYRWVGKPILYCGPEGISEKAEARLGRFSNPKLLIITKNGFIFFDHGKRMFYRIDFERGLVKSGPAIAREIEIQEFGYDKNPDMISLSFSEPYRKPNEIEKQAIVKDIKERAEKSGETLTEKEINERLEKSLQIYEEFRGHPGGMALVEKSGAIRILNYETLELGQIVGELPGAPPFTKYNRPDDLLAYQIKTFWDKEGNYRGMASAGVSREGFGFAVNVFDKDGKDVGGNKSVLEPEKMMNGTLLMFFKYVLESLHPAVLNFASFFSGGHFEAAAGYRSIFILPDSYAAMIGRTIGYDAINLIAVFIITLPSILLGAVLGFWVKRDARAMGLSRRAQRLWAAGTVCFGISAYITYRLTRPDVTMVSCINCGKLRRPDMDLCQHCGSKWEVPELAAPSWKVV